MEVETSMGKRMKIYFLLWCLLVRNSNNFHLCSVSCNSVTDECWCNGYDNCNENCSCNTGNIAQKSILLLLWITFGSFLIKLLIAFEWNKNAWKQSFYIFKSNIVCNVWNKFDLLTINNSKCNGPILYFVVSNYRGFLPYATFGTWKNSH